MFVFNGPELPVKKWRSIKEKNERKQLVQSCQHGASLLERTQHEFAPPFEPEHETQTSKIPAVFADAKNSIRTPTMSALNHLAGTKVIFHLSLYMFLINLYKDV